MSPMLVLLVLLLLLLPLLLLLLLSERAMRLYSLRNKSPLPLPR